MTESKTHKPHLYKQRGYFAFRLMADLHRELFPDQKSVDGNSRIAHKIYHALNKAYTDGIEDAAQMEDDKLQRIRRRIYGRTPKDC
jgi:hypothetical protein